MEEHVGGLCDSSGIQRYMHTGVCLDMCPWQCMHSVCRCVGTYLYQYMEVRTPGGLPWGKV